MSLEIETECYTDEQREEQFCKICHLEYIEGVFHFLFTWPLYQAECSTYYVDSVQDIGNFISRGDIDRLASMLSDDNIQDTAKFVEKNYDKRCSIMYKSN